MYRFKARSPRPLAQKAGIEPTLTESKSVAFPFGYFCVFPCRIARSCIKLLVAVRLLMGCPIWKGDISMKKKSSGDSGWI